MGITREQFVTELIGCTEFIQRVVKGWADGSLPKPDLPAVTRYSDLRFAPWCARGVGSNVPGAVPYTASSLGKLIESLPGGEGACYAVGRDLKYRQPGLTFRAALALLEAVQLKIVSGKIVTEIEQGLWDQRSLLQFLQSKYRKYLRKKR